MTTIDIDSNLANADWPKQTLDAGLPTTYEEWGRLLMRMSTREFQGFLATPTGVTAVETHGEKFIDLVSRAGVARGVTPYLPPTDTVEPMTRVASVEAPGVLADWTSPALALLNQKTGDGRALAGEITWRNPPLPLMAQLEDAHGSMPVMQSRMAGSIDGITQEDDRFPAHGTIDDTEVGRATAEALATGRYGVSIDLSVQEAEIVLKGWSEDDGMILLADAEKDEVEATEPSVAEEAGLAEPDDMVISMSVDDELLVVTKGRIMGATVVPFAAFEDATITITASGEDGMPSMIRLVSPVSMFMTYRPAGVSSDVLAAVSALEDAVEADKLPALATAVSAGIMTPDEARAALGRPPLADPQPASVTPLKADAATLLEELRSSAAEREAALQTLTEKVNGMSAAPAKITFDRDEQGRIIGARRTDHVAE